jgi:hypothetical protein
MRTFLSLSLSSFLLLGTAHGAQITRVDARTLHLDGEIASGDAARLERMYAPGTALLKVHSPGGNSEEAMRMGRFIHARKLDLEIDRGCASSCANYLFPAAAHKTIPSGAVLGFHGTAYLTDLAGEESMRAQLSANGMAPKAVAKALPSMLDYVRRLARQEGEFAADIGVNPQFYRDFKTVAEHGEALDQQYAPQHATFLWWPAAQRLAQCYGVDNVTDQARPPALASTGHAFETRRALLLVGDQALPACTH